MLVQFSVKKFKSFKEKQDFSMEAGIGDENLDNIINIDELNERVLKTTALYGANASGKTNLIKAFSAAIMMIRLSNNRQPEEKLLQMEPFAFDENTKKEPCEFEFIFYTNSNKYVYGFKADKEKVYEEYLYQYLSAKPTRIFERTNCNDYKFLQVDEAKLNAIKSQNLENKLFLSTATTWNYDKTRAPYLWFANMIDTYIGGNEFNPYSIEAYNKDDENESLKKFTLKLLEEADIIIKDYNIEIEEAEMDARMIMQLKNMNVPSNVIVPKTTVIKSITMSHEVTDEEGNTKVYNLDLGNESSGTKIIFAMAPILKDVFEKGKLLVIDEIERSLHPNLVEMIIKFFHNAEINKANAQLIFNTHDTNLLSLDLFRRDQIWFAEKDPKKGATELYPLDDFSVRKTENIQKGYLNGRYGAIPFVATGNNLWQE
ncbi:MAG TPA: ATP-binding protein [Clostridia bacterium]|nr:ATP-binding protein [Clostridia bacterium]